MIQNQLAERPAAELSSLLRLWSQAYKEQDAAELSLAIEGFVNQLQQNLAGEPLAAVEPADMGSAADFVPVKAAAQVSLTNDDVSERGWDTDDACAELTAMVEQLRSYQELSNLLVDWSAPGAEWKRSHSNIDDLIDIISPMGFLDALEDFLVNLADTKASFAKFRTA